MDITKQSVDLLKRLFKSLQGNIKLRLWNGESLKLGNSLDITDSNFVLIFRNVGAVKSLVFGNDPLRFAEAYFRNDIDVEGDFFAALKLKDHLNALRVSLLEKIQSLIIACHLFLSNRKDLASNNYHSLEAESVRTHSKLENKEAVSFHYDVSNEFYALWLDKNMIYSCGYFNSPTIDLDQSQLDKLDHICKKLTLRPDEKFLDIGSGWGGLVIHAARHSGVISNEITLSQRQFEFAK